MSDHDPVVIALQLDAAILKGDWDTDGDVDIDDIRGFMRAIRSRQEVSIAFDLNDDGVLNYSDVRAMSRICTLRRCAR